MAKTKKNYMHKQYTFLALGDSYTVGEGVLLHRSFPYQTVQALRRSGYDASAPEILAQTGWTTEELATGVQEYAFLPKYDFVTLLIGVNNQYRDQDIVLYKQQFESLLKKSLELTSGKKDHVFVLSIPDYSITPFVREKDKAKISKEIDEYNKLNKAVSIQYKTAYLDVAEDFREAKDSPILLASDGLHPSEVMYARWAKRLAEAFEKLLKK